MKVPVELVNGIIRVARGAKLQPMTVLLNTQYDCLCLSGNLNPPLAAHPAPPSTPPLAHYLICAIHVIAVIVRKVASSVSYVAQIVIEH